MAGRKYTTRRLWMRTGVQAKAKNLALEEATVKRTRAIYRQASKDIQRRAEALYKQFGVLDTANHWNFTGLNNPATKKSVTELRKAIEKAGLMDFVPQNFKNKMSVLEVQQINNWLTLQNAGQDSHALTKQALLKGMQNNGKAWIEVLGAGAESFVGFDRNICGYMMGMNWEDGNFSDRLWNNTNETWEKVRDELTRALANGQQPNVTKAHIKRLVEEGYQGKPGGLNYSVERIVRTELAKASTQADIARWREMGVTKVMWHATFEANTCYHCQERDGRIYELKKLLDEPPLHPNCRCYFAPYDEVFAEFPDTTYYKDQKGEYQEIQWAPYKTVIDASGALRSSPLKVSDYFWNTSPWTQYKPPKTDITYKGELNQEVIEYVQRTVASVTDQFPEIGERIAHQFNNEIYLHRGESTLVGNSWDKIGGLTDPAMNQLTISYPAGITKNVLTEMADIAKTQYSQGFWATGKANGTIIHELGHVLVEDLKTRGIKPATIIKQATQKSTLKEALATVKSKISRYGGKNADEAFAELFSKMMSQDIQTTDAITARFSEALGEAVKLPRVKKQITVE